MGVSTQSASASSLSSASPSALCTTIFLVSRDRRAERDKPELVSSVSEGSRALLRAVGLRGPERGSKSVLNEVVVLKYYVSSTSISKLDASVLKYQAKWQAGAKALAKAIESCAKSLE